MNRREAIKRVAWLMGGALSAPALAGMLGGCRAGTDGAHALQTLDPDQHELVATIAELIIPETDTPGARAAGVDAFVDLMMTEWYPEADRENFLAGLAHVEAYAQHRYGAPFLEATPEEQVELLMLLDREAFPSPQPPPVERDEDPREITDGAGDDPLSDPVTVDGPGAQPVVAGGPFFRTMKELTLLGYYTSEVGATQELQWIAAPGHFQGCAPIEEVGRTWA